MNDEERLKKIEKNKFNRIRFHKIARWFEYIGGILFIVSIILLILNASDFSTNRTPVIVFSCICVIIFIFLICTFCFDFGFKKDIMNYDVSINEIERQIEENKKYIFDKRDILGRAGIEDILEIGAKYVAYGNHNLYIWNRDYIDFGAYKEIAYDQFLQEDLISKLLSVSIKYDEIIFFSKEGDIQYTTEIFGGGGGGSSISGAIVGGIVAGSTGAIIGSRKQMNEVSSRTITHDSRHTLLRYKKKISVSELKFPSYMVYDFLLRHFPEKDLIYLQMGQNTYNNNASMDETKNSTEEKLMSLNALYEKNLISEEEYQSKRKKIIDEL